MSLSFYYRDSLREYSEKGDTFYFDSDLEASILLYLLDIYKQKYSLVDYSLKIDDLIRKNIILESGLNYIDFTKLNIEIEKKVLESKIKNIDKRSNKKL